MNTHELTKVSTIAAALALTCSSPAAWAQNGDATGSLDPTRDASHGSEPIAERLPGRVHSGFFARATLGASLLTSDVTLPEQGAKAHMTGAGPTTSLLLGGTPSSGLVVGGGLLLSSFSNPSVVIKGEQVQPGYDVTFRLISIGPFFQYYPDPTAGFHVQAFAGYMSARAEVEDAAVVSQPDTGPAIALATGYDFWVGKEWSMGPAFQLLFAALEYSGEGSDERMSVVTPTVSFSATFH